MTSPTLPAVRPTWISRVLHRHLYLWWCLVCCAGPPKDFEPIGVEHLSGPEATAVEASRATGAAAGDTGTAGAAAKSSGELAASASKTPTSGSRGEAAAPAGDTVEIVKGRLQVKCDSDYCMITQELSLTFIWVRSSAGRVQAGYFSLQYAVHSQNSVAVLD